MEEVATVIFDFIKAALINAGVKAASYVIRKVSYDAAVWIASGGKGQGAMAQTKSFGKYLEDVAGEAGGSAIEELSSKAGMNLCKVPDLKIDLAIKVGLRKDFVGGANPKKPACTVAEFAKNWSTGLSKFSKPEELTKAFNLSLTTEESSDFGIYGEAREKIGNKVAVQKEGKTFEREEGEGFNAGKTKVSDQITNPAANVKKTAGAQTPDETVKSNEEQLNAALSSGDIKVFPTILSIFLSTLGSTVISNFQTKGILPFGLCIGGMGGADCQAKSLSGGLDITDPNSGGSASAGRLAAQSFFSFLTAVKIAEPTRYDLISELNSCPTAPGTPGIYNCRAGDDLVTAINQGLTIGEAIKIGLLDGNKLLIPPSIASKNNDINCYRDSYCLNNVRVLRQVRVLPVGFQMAVEQSPPGQPWKLIDVVNGFYDCGSTVNDPAKPFCHLIDPNWVLKVPLAKCNALVNSASLASADVPNRLQECVDLQTCVVTNPDGSCADYAYCTREKNTWKFPADSCNEQFATCRSYQNEAGSTVSYLMNTIDKSFCTPENVGCRAYSLTAGISSGWQDPRFDSTKGANTGIYLNNNVETNCPASSAGCSAFQVASLTSVQLALRKAPDYLGCYDSTPTTPTVDWPTDRASLDTIAGSPDCSKYAQVCTAAEQGCNWYTPVSGGGTRIPGNFEPAEIVNNQVVWNDQCDAKCVGYNVYREMPTNYSNGVPLAYIIPSSGATCTVQDVGCSSFTNLSTSTGQGEQVAYFTNLRACLKPAETPDGRGKTYITYEGSGQTGFQLKTYSLLNDSIGSTCASGETNCPQYFFKDPDELVALNAECTKDRYQRGVASLDCRQFNDDAGTIYYRLLSHTIPVTNDCTPYRITEPAFYVDPLVGVVGATNRKDACLTENGFWDDSVVGSEVCKMCLSNGKYKNGICLYEGLAAGVANNAGTSATCVAAADTCRAYKGNAGNNIQEIFYDTFEDASSINNWTAVSGARSWSTVSTHVGEHSIEFNPMGSSSGEVRRAVTLEIGKTYDLIFWAYSDSDAELSVNIFTTGVTAIPIGTVSTVSIRAGVWQQYHLGPVEYLANSSNASLVFGWETAVDGKSIYLDNIRLTKVTDFIYLAKKTLSVDPVCDSTPNDGNPGEALGCSAYKDPQNRPFYLTNFSSICREGAIGCTGLFDTRNTVSPLDDSYNVWFTGAPLSTPSHNIPATGGFSYSCTVPAGQTGCYINITGRSISEILGSVTDGSIAVNNSTVTISSDTPSNRPIFLVADQRASCSQADLGCTYAGAQTYNALGEKVFITTTIKNDPSHYSDTLCQSEAVGCSAYSAGADVQYFKDPALSGQKSCEYRTNVTVGGVSTDGWFEKNPVGTCTNNTAVLCTKGSAEADCGAGKTCDVSDNVACAPISTDVYVVELNNHRVQKRNSRGMFTGSFGSKGTDSGQLQWPVGIAIDTPGNIYVADTYNNRIQKFDSEGSFLLGIGGGTTWTSVIAPATPIGSGAQAFNSPEGIALDIAGNIYVADTKNNRIQKFNSSGGYLASFTDTRDFGSFYRPSGIAVTPDGYIYIADFGNNRVVILNPSGQGVDSTGGYGTGIGEFSGPSGIAVDAANNIYVTDMSNHRIQKYNLFTGLNVAFGSLGSGPGQFKWPVGITLDTDGNIYVADRGNNRIQKLSSDGVWLASYGSFGSFPGQFDAPIGIAINSNANRFINLCPADQDKCTQFIDHADVKDGEAQSYFLIKDDKVTEGNCSGQVSQKGGCALFEETGPDVLDKLWNTISSYTDSNTKNGALVVPISNSGNDANTIMKVVQDRECGQWLKAQQSYSIYDDQTNAYKEKSLGSLALCDSTGCALRQSVRILDADIYRQRPTGWADMDYSGFSIPGSYPAESLSQVNISLSDVADWRLLAPVSCSWWGEPTWNELLRRFIRPVVQDTRNCGTSGGMTCLIENTPCGEQGWCKNKRCVVNVDGSPIPGSSVGRQICRAYPEADSPFPSTDKIMKSGFFKNAHICDEGDKVPDGFEYKCECDYRKVKYGEVFTKYWKSDLDGSLDRSLITPNDSLPAGFCLGGVKVNTAPTPNEPMDGKECSNDKACGEGGVCELMKNLHSFVGLRGFCLEKDSSRHINSDPDQNACLTWFPIETLSGASDINNQNITALSDWQKGASSGGQYCLNSTAPPNSMSFNLGFSAAGIKNGGVFDPTNDQGFGAPKYQISFASANLLPYPHQGCNFDYWGAHSRARVDDVDGKFKIFDQGGGNTLASALSNSNLANINIDDIEEIDVEVIYSMGHVGIGQYNLNIDNVSTIFRFPNLTDKTGLQPYYHVSHPGDAAGNITGAVAGGFYKDGTGTHFIMLYTGHDEATFPSLGGKTALTPDRTVESRWTMNYAGAPTIRTFEGLKGSMTADKAIPLTDNSGVTDIWTLSNDQLTSACPHPDVALPQYDAGYFPILWHAMKLDFLPTFRSVDTFFCGRWGMNTPASIPSTVYRSCDIRYDHQGKDEIEYKITFKLRQTCQMVTNALVDVARNKFSDVNRTVPYTNRLWKINSSVVPPVNDYQTANPVFNYDQPYSPFGRLNLVNDLPENLINLSPNPTPPAKDDCGGGAITSCADFQADYVPETPYGTTAYSSPISALSSGVTSLSALYANVFANYRWNGTSYVPAPSGVGLVDITASTPITPSLAPQIHPLKVPKNVTPAGYEEVSALGFSITDVNGNPTTDAISAPFNSLSVSLQFFMFANADRMPLRQVTVDWGDGRGQEPLEGYFRNKRGLIAGSPPTLACQPTSKAVDYGHIKDQTCDNGYFQFNKIYNCVDKSDTTIYKPSAECGAGSFPNGCCVFKPKIQVKDNWGGCNGTCGDALSPGGTGCMDAKRGEGTAASGVDECSEGAGNNPWTPFPGESVILRYN